MTLNKDTDSIKKVAEVLCGGGVVILPTDTVYGFSGLAGNSSSPLHTDDRIRQIKGRSESKPLIQLVSTPEKAMEYSAVQIPEKLLEKWPGPLTIIVPVKPGLYNFPAETVAFRCPGDEWLRSVLELCPAPVFSTSVNRSGERILETYEEIEAEFGKEADLIVNDGDKKGGVPSTLLMLENDGSWKVLRQGIVQV